MQDDEQDVPTPTHITPLSNESMDTSPGVSSAQDIPLEAAMRQKLKLRKKLMEASHHAEFLKSA